MTFFRFLVIISIHGKKGVIPMYNEKGKKLVIYLLMICLAIPVLFFIASYSPAEFPPYVFVNGEAYKATGPEIPQLPDHCEFLGEISSSVSSSKMPTENFQANRSLVGALIYQYGSNILIFHNNRYYIGYGPDENE